MNTAQDSSIKSYTKSDKSALAQHFNVCEFKCHCKSDHEILISDELISKLEDLFAILDCSKIIIFSGHRCPDHDKNVGGNGHSSHTEGKAADIICYDKNGQIIDHDKIFQAARSIHLQTIENASKTNPTTHIEIPTDNRQAYCTEFGVITSKQHDSILNGTYHRGIDVSVHNGEIDWEKVKLAGIEFSIIRISYGNNCEEQDDRKATINISECERLKIPYGVYHYSYALSVEDIEDEVNHVLRFLNGKKPPLGVWLDMEDADGFKKKHNKPLNFENGEMYSEMCHFFCRKIKEVGIDYCGVYASKFILEGVLDVFDLNLWVANWAMYCVIDSKFDFWQHSSKGKVDGIDGNVDLDYCLKNFDVFEKKDNCNESDDLI